MNFAGNKALGAIANSDEQGPHLVDARRRAQLRTARCSPRDTTASDAGRTGAPRVENSIETRIEQIVVPRGQGGQRAGAQRGSIDRASELGFERGHTVAQTWRIRGQADVQSVTKN